MSAILLLASAGSRNMDLYTSPRTETYGDRKRKWFNSLSTEKKNELLTTVQRMCESINKSEMEDYNHDMKIYDLMMNDYNKKSWLSKLFSSKPVMPILPQKIECKRFWDNGWCTIWNQYGLGYTEN